MTLLNNFPHTCSLYERRVTRSSRMGSSERLVRMETGVKCWVQNATQAEITEYIRRDISVKNAIYFTSDWDLDETQYILITAGPTHVSKLFAVKDFAERTAGRGVAWAAMAENERSQLDKPGQR